MSSEGLLAAVGVAASELRIVGVAVAVEDCSRADRSPQAATAMITAVSTTVIKIAGIRMITSMCLAYTLSWADF